MFAKLLKYEWKATGRLLGILSLAAALAGASGAASLHFILNYATGASSSADEAEQMVEAIAISGLSMLLLFVILALAAYYAGTQIVLLYRFYKSKFTDEGYLTFTLPVRNQQIVLSSWVNMLIWSAISGLIVAASSVAMVFVIRRGMEQLFTDIGAIDAPMDIFGDIFKDAVAQYGAGYYIMNVFSAVINWLIAPLIMMTCITVGAVGAKKHKILLAITIYYGYSMLSGIVKTVVSAVVEILALTTGTQALTELTVTANVLIQLLLGVLCWILTNYLMRRKLNLP